MTMKRRRKKPSVNTNPQKIVFNALGRPSLGGRFISLETARSLIESGFSTGFTPAAKKLVPKGSNKKAIRQALSGSPVGGDFGEPFRNREPKPVPMRRNKDSAKREYVNYKPILGPPTQHRVFSVPTDKEQLLEWAKKQGDHKASFIVAYRDSKGHIQYAKSRVVRPTDIATMDREANRLLLKYAKAGDIKSVVDIRIDIWDTRKSMEQTYGATEDDIEV